MLEVLGYASRAALMDAIVPAAIRRKAPLALPGAMTEAQALARMRSIASRNKVLKSFIGQGYYGTHTPGVILRNVLENPAWYTAYTPYQPEISQGRLEALINFQTMVCDLTAMAIANASMLDEATAAAEAMTLCHRVGHSESNRFFVADDVFAQTIDVVLTRAKPLAIEVVIGPAADAAKAGAFAVLLQYPGTNGDVRDYRALAELVHAGGGHVIVAADLLALTLLTPPGEWGADVVVGSAQRFGVPMGYGGPHAGYLATRDEHKRSMPGRLVGVTVDANGGPAYRLALQTREQHIRREKATSNICTAQVLLAVIAGMYAVYHGPSGLTTIARRVHRLTAILKAGLERLGHAVPTAHFFDTIVVATGDATLRIADRGVAQRMNFRRVDARTLGVSLDETTTRADVEAIWQAFGGDGASGALAELFASAPEALPDALRRGSKFLTHPTFERYHSETEMLRYLRRLADRDIALDRAMIPLGSCTMKLNATSEMIPVTWPEFGDLHPVRPAGPGRRLSRARRRPRAHALRRDRLRGGVAAAQRRLAGRVRRAARHPGVPREPRRGASQRLPHPRVRARHEPGVGADGRHARGRGRLRRRRQCRPGRPRSEGAGASRESGGDHGHLSVHARRVRGRHRPRLRHRACAWRPGLRRRRQPQRAGRTCARPGSSARTSRT